MHERINKPRVFLSHSSKDKDFIHRLAEDLRKCQVEYWLDTEEIRDGRSWLKVIFEDGIPTCDVVIVYLTESSIISKMVAKELDAALIVQLSEKEIVLLPYISKSDIREKLRSDIRSLHCREWNHDNYNAILPSVVAEIWRSFLERTINIAITQEKNRRLELELELRDLKKRYEDSPFSPSEDTDFKYIYDKLNKQVKIIFHLWTNQYDPSSKIGKVAFKISCLDSIIYYINKAKRFEMRHFVRIISDFLNERGFPEAKGQNYGHGYINEKENIEVELQSYGLMYKDEFKQKMYRFRYWLGYNNYLTDEVSFEYLGFIE